MKMAYATVTSIKSDEQEIFGFLYGMKVSRHRAMVTEVCFTGGYRLECISSIDEAEAVLVIGQRIEVGDRFRIMALPCGTVVSFKAEGIAHLPAAALTQQQGTN